MGVEFEVERSADPRRASDAEMLQRFDTMEREIIQLKRIVAKLKAKVLPNDSDAA